MKPVWVVVGRYPDGLAITHFVDPHRPKNTLCGATIGDRVRRYVRPVGSCCPLCAQRAEGAA